MQARARRQPGVRWYVHAMEAPTAQRAALEFGNVYQMIRLFERRHLHNINQVQRDLLVELYRNDPTPLMMKVLALSAHCAESTLRHQVLGLIERQWVVDVPMDDSRARFLKLTPTGRSLLHRYRQLVVSHYTLLQGND